MPSSTGTLVFNDQKIQAPDIYATESLGVGVSDPTSNLQVVGNAYVSSNLEVGTANLFVDTTTGRVGVGTRSPDSLGKLHVNGNVYVGNDNYLMSGYASTGDDQYFGKEYDGRIIAGMEIENTTLNGNYSQKLHLRTHHYGTTEGRRFTIDESGNVGINTATPGFNLDVNGSFGAKNKGWYITSSSGGNAVYNSANPNKNYFAYNVSTTVYGDSVTTYNGASSSAWNSTDGVFTYPEAGLYQVTIHMFINATSSGRYGTFILSDSGGTTQFSQYMYFTPSGYGSNYQRSWTTFVRVQSGWKSYMTAAGGGSITLYLADQHTCLLIDKIY